MKPEWGAEIDLRSDVGHSNAIHLSHDPWIRGDNFDDWIGEYRRLGLKGPVILNTKEDGLEATVIKKMEAAGLFHFFFLDTALPTLVRWSLNLGEKRFAARLSRHEPALALTPFIGKIDWVWVDCFDGQPLETEIVREVKRHFRICLVAPELQGQPASDIGHFRELVQLSDAICTKIPV